MGTVPFFPFLGQTQAADDVRRDQLAAVGHGRHQAGHLQGRGRQRALPDAQRLRVGGAPAGEKGDSPHLCVGTVPIFPGQRAGRFARQVNARGAAEPELFRPIHERTHSH